MLYDYDFKENKEDILYEKTNAIIEIGANLFELCLVITNKNILIFANVNKNNVLNSRGMYMPPEYLLNLQIPLQDLKYQVVEENTEFKFNNQDIIIYDFDLTKYQL